MNEARLDELLATVRGALRAGTAPGAPSAPGCLSFARARALVLDPERWRADERAHVAGCRRCARLLHTFEQEMPHLSLWSLLRSRLGRLASDEARAVEYHLREGGCRRCRERVERLGAALERVIQFPGPVPLPAPGAVGAATAVLDAVARSPDRVLEAELVEEDGRVLLEVRTKNATLKHRLVGYTLRGARQADAQEGFLVLQPDVEGWLTAQTTFDPEELYSRLQGRCEEVLLCPVDTEVLSYAEREALLASAEQSRKEAAAREGWMAWVMEAVQKSESVSDRTWQLLCEVRERLER
jgi:hypothetical protein